MTDRSYQVITLKVPSEHCDAIEGCLYDEGCLGLIEEDEKESMIVIKAYFNDDSPLSDRCRQVALVPHLVKIIDSAAICYGDSNFQAASFEPIRLTGDYWIVPPEDLACPNIESVAGSSEYTIVIRPGMAFGTGRHETTQLCAEAILNLENRPTSLLDVGTGSGILAILAGKRGIAQIAAVEISPEARLNAEENLRLNGLRAIPMYDDIKSVQGTFDVVVVNILTPTILHLKTELLARLNPTGTLIVSGITHGEETKIEKAFCELKLLVKSERDGWFCYVYEVA